MRKTRDPRRAAIYDAALSARPRNGCVLVYTVTARLLVRVGHEGRVLCMAGRQGASSGVIYGEGYKKNTMLRA